MGNSRSLPATQGDAGPGAANVRDTDDGTWNRSSLPASTPSAMGTAASATPSAQGGAAARDAIAQEEKSLERLQDESNLRVALALWLNVHLPDVKKHIRLMLLGPPSQLGAGGGGAAAAAATPAASDGRFALCVEAAGSGTPLIPRLEVTPTTSVGELKGLIARRLDGRPIVRQLLFAGHGGPQLTGFFDLLSASGIAAGGVTTVALGVAAIAVRREGVRVCIGGLEDSNMEDLQSALRCDDASACLLALDLDPHSIPFWEWDPDGHFAQRCFLDGEQGDASKEESILRYARRLGLPSQRQLENWAADLDAARERELPVAQRLMTK